MVDAVSEMIGLTNVTGIHARGEDVDGSFDFVLSRAVTRLSKFIPWIEHKINETSNHELGNGILCLKGGDLTHELSETPLETHVTDLSETFSEEFFETKKIVYIPIIGNNGS